jgi:hypothetical protein
MIINVIERNGSDCKYVDNFTNHVGSIGAPYNSILYYLCAEPTATRPITGTAQCNNNNNNNRRHLSAPLAICSQLQLASIVNVIVRYASEQRVFLYVTHVKCGSARKCR